MSKRNLTEEQAWKVLEEVFSYRAGLCFAINGLHQRGLISIKTYLKMHDRVRAVKAHPLADKSYKWPVEYTNNHDKYRVKFAEQAAKRAAKGKR